MVEWVAGWGTAEWSLAVAVLALLGIDGARGWRVLRWVLRGGKSAPPAPIPVVVHPPPPEPEQPKSTALLGSPPAPVRVFGREGELADLRTRLTNAPDRPVALVNSGAVLAGQGGIGKTTLAREYARLNAGDYDAILWTLAATRQNVIEGLCAAADHLGLPRPNPPQLADAQAVCTRITARIADQGERWLIVCDNVEEAAHLDGLMPIGAHLLVTTRQGQGWAGWDAVRTDVLGFDSPDAPAVRLLMAHAGRDDDAAGAQRLAGLLGGLPLALIVMGAYLKDQALSFDQGCEHWHHAVTNAPQNAGYDDSVFGAVKLSYDKLPEDAQTLARLLSYWAPEGLGPRLLLDAPGGQNWKAVLDLIPEPLQELVQDEARVRAAFTALAARSLITGRGETRAMHRLTAAALRDMDQTALAPAAVALLAAVYPGGEQNPGHSPQFPLCARLTPHVRALMASGAAPTVAFWDYLLNQAGGYLNAIADFPGCLALAQASLAAKQRRGLPESDRALAMAHGNLGMAWMRVGDRDAAERKLNRALELTERHRPGSADHASALELLGGLMLDRVQAGERNRLGPTIRLYRQALAIRRRAGPRSMEVAGALNNLGTAHSLQGRKREAARLFGAALAIWRDFLAPGDARLATSAMNVGSICLELGAAAEAEDLLREALGIWEAVFADQPDHPDRRNAAGWLISCLMVRARQGVNRGMREAEARRLCGQYGFDYDERVAKARDYPDAPLP